MKPVIQLNNFSYTYPNTTVQALKNISLDIHAGECLCVSGPSGCGKTTLLMAVAGLLKQFDGRNINLMNLRPGAGIGMVFQNADTQILCTTVEDEVAFGPENQGLSQNIIRQRVRNALEAVGLTGFEKRNVETLSAGRKQRLTIASVLSMQPEWLLLDEPSGQLDPPGKQQLIGVLKGLKEKGYGLLIADHEPAVYRLLVDRYILMKEGRVEKISAEPSPEVQLFSRTNRAENATILRDTLTPAIEIKGLQLYDPDGHFIFNQFELKVLPGEFVYIFGLNGAGKSTLLRYIVGLVDSSAGMIRIADMESPHSEQLLGTVGMLFQNPQRQLFETTVYAEVAFSLKRLGLATEQIHERVMETLHLCGVSNLKERSPLTLSFGEQHRVALASAIAPRPKILLLDEPFAGLDFLQRQRIINLISKLRERYQTAVVLVSHNPLPDNHWADRHLILENGYVQSF
ncbi:MAG: ATP-binding cassette domain-containing protein [Desulfobacterales bacterium]|nr:ATP-binding cassette domain-containing protein [Desulfobacterales bacterium]